MKDNTSVSASEALNDINKWCFHISMSSNKQTLHRDLIGGSNVSFIWLGASMLKNYVKLFQICFHKMFLSQSAALLWFNMQNHSKSSSMESDYSSRNIIHISSIITPVNNNQLGWIIKAAPGWRSLAQMDLLIRPAPFRSCSDPTLFTLKGSSWRSVSSGIKEDLLEQLPHPQQETAWTDGGAFWLLQLQLAPQTRLAAPGSVHNLLTSYKLQMLVFC